MLGTSAEVSANNKMIKEDVPVSSMHEIMLRYWRWKKLMTLTGTNQESWPYKGQVTSPGSQKLQAPAGENISWLSASLSHTFFRTFVDRWQRMVPQLWRHLIRQLQLQACRLKDDILKWFIEFGDVWLTRRFYLCSMFVAKDASSFAWNVLKCVQNVSHQPNSECWMNFTEWEGFHLPHQNWWNTKNTYFSMQSGTSFYENLKILGVVP